MLLLYGLFYRDARCIVRLQDGSEGKGVVGSLVCVGILKRREHSIAKRMAWGGGGSKFDNCIRNHLEKNTREKFSLAPRGAVRGNLATMIVGVVSPSFRGGLLLFRPRFTYNLIAGFCPACQFGRHNCVILGVRHDFVRERPPPRVPILIASRCASLPSLVANVHAPVFGGGTGSFFFPEKIKQELDMRYKLFSGIL